MASLIIGSTCIFETSPRQSCSFPESTRLKERYCGAPREGTRMSGLGVGTAAAPFSSLQSLLWASHGCPFHQTLGGAPPVPR